MRENPAARQEAPRPDMVTLRAAFGQDEANHGTVRYLVGCDGLFRVPLQVAEPLVATGGFAVEQPARDFISAGGVRLHHAEAVGCCFHGRSYQADENGDVVVPAEAAAELMAHGFVAVLPTLSPSKMEAKEQARGRG